MPSQTVLDRDAWLVGLAPPPRPVGDVTVEGIGEGASESLSTGSASADHDKKTSLGWALVDGTGKRAFVAPDDPRHPRHTKPARATA